MERVLSRDKYSSPLWKNKEDAMNVIFDMEENTKPSALQATKRIIYKKDILLMKHILFILAQKIHKCL